MNEMISPPVLRRVTVKDVAERAGVAHPAVSVVLNGARSNLGVSQATRQRILQAADELGYRRHAGAAGMQSGRFHNIGLLLGESWRDNALPTFGWPPLFEALEARGFHLTAACLHDAQLDEGAALPRVLRESMTDGFLVSYAGAKLARLDEVIAKYRLPAVWVNWKRDFDCAYPDDATATFEATQRLLDLGHVRIAYVHNPASQHYSTPERLRGYQNAMTMAERAPQVLRWDVDGRSRESVLFEAQEWLRGPNRPTAFLLYEAWYAAPLYAAALRSGLQIPHDLSLLATTYEKAELRYDLPLARMVIPFDAVGESAVEMLMEKIARPEVQLPPRALPFSFDSGATLAAP